jgi:alkaline phosphatase D
MGVSFPYGVASGDPGLDGIVLQTGIAGGSGDVALRWWVGADADAAGSTEAAGPPVAEGHVTAEASADHTARVVVDGLAPGTRYRYGFVAADGTASPVGRFRTLAASPDRVRLGVVACAKHNAGFFNAYGRLAERDDLDLVLHLGDYIYEAANKPPASQTPGADIGRDMDPLEECRRLDQYRTRYRQYRSDPDLRAMHAAHAVVATIDDHELADNAWSGGAQEHDEERDGPWAERVREAMTAWSEWVPSRTDPVSGGPIHRALELGDLARIALCETRRSRTEPGTDRQQLGASQMSWLEAQLAPSGAGAPTPAWSVLAVASPLLPIWTGSLSGRSIEALRKLKMVDAEGTGPATDRWDGFPTERAAVLDLLAAAPGGHLVLNGDVHVALHGELATADGRRAGLECTTPSVSSQNLDDKMGWPRGGSAPHQAALVAEVPGLRWCDLDSHGYLVVDLTRDRAVVEWWGVDAVLERVGTEALLHRVEVRPGDTRP